MSLQPMMLMMLSACMLLSALAASAETVLSDQTSSFLAATTPPPTPPPRPHDRSKDCLPSRFRPSVVEMRNVTVEIERKKYNVATFFLNDAAEPFIIKGVGYSPIPPGKKTLMEPFDYFTANYKYIWKRDLPLIHDMNANIVRTWSWDATKDHTDFLDMCYDKGIMVLVPFLVSDTFYQNLADPNTHHQMLLDFKTFVLSVKDHPAVFGYMIGNELNEEYPGQVEELLSIVNAMVDIRNEVDDVRHPITVPFSDNEFNKELVEKYYPWLNIDFWSLQIYRPQIDQVIYNYTKLVTEKFGNLTIKPLVLTEYGVDALQDSKCQPWNHNCQPSDVEKLLGDIPTDEQKQAEGFCDRFMNISSKLVHYPTKMGVGVVAGGVVMEYVDEWWKGTFPDVRREECPTQRTDIHTYCSQNINKDNTTMPFYLYEEWLGLFSQDDPGTGEGMLGQWEMQYCIRPRRAYHVMAKAYKDGECSADDAKKEYHAARHCASAAKLENNPFLMFVAPLGIVVLLGGLVYYCQLRTPVPSHQEEHKNLETFPPSDAGADEDDEKAPLISKTSMEDLEVTQKARSRSRKENLKRQDISEELHRMINFSFWCYTASDNETQDLKVYLEETKLPTEDEIKKMEEKGYTPLHGFLTYLAKKKRCTHFMVPQRRLYHTIYDVHKRLTMDPAVMSNAHQRNASSILHDAIRIVYEKVLEADFLYNHSDNNRKVPLPDGCPSSETMIMELAMNGIVQQWAGTINHAPEKICEVFHWAKLWYNNNINEKPIQLKDYSETEWPMVLTDLWKYRAREIKDLHHGLVEIMRTYILKVDQAEFTFEDINEDAVYKRKIESQKNKKVDVFVVDRRTRADGDGRASPGVPSEEDYEESDQGVAQLPQGSMISSNVAKLVIGTEADLLPKREEFKAIVAGELPIKFTHLEYNVSSNPEESVMSRSADKFFKQRAGIAGKWFPKEIAFPQKGGIWALMLNYQWLIRYTLWQGAFAYYAQPATLSAPICLSSFLVVLAFGDAMWNWLAMLMHRRALGRFKKRRGRLEAIGTTLTALGMFVVLVLTKGIKPTSGFICEYVDGSCPGHKLVVFGLHVDAALAYIAACIGITIFEELRLLIFVQKPYSISGRFKDTSMKCRVRGLFAMGFIVVGAAACVVWLVLLQNMGDSTITWWPNVYKHLFTLFMPPFICLVAWFLSRTTLMCSANAITSRHRTEIIEESNYLVSNLIFWGLFFILNWSLSYYILIPSVDNIQVSICECDKREGLLNTSQYDLCKWQFWSMCWVAVIFSWISACLVSFVALYAVFELLLLVFGVIRAKYIRVGNVQNWHEVDKHWENIITTCLPRLSLSLADTRDDLVKASGPSVCPNQANIWDSFIESLKADNLLSIDESEALMVPKDSNMGSRQRPNFRKKPRSPEAQRRIISYMWGLQSLWAADGNNETMRVTVHVHGQAITRPFTTDYRRQHRVTAMPSLTTLIPVYNEPILLSRQQLRKTRDEGSLGKRITEIEYVALIYTAEWQNFAEKMKATAAYGTDWVLDKKGDSYSSDLLNAFLGIDHPRPLDDVKDQALISEIEWWASMRGQTLSRTIKGFTNQRKGLLQLARLEEDKASDLEIMRLVNRKYQLLISHQTFNHSKIGEGDNENHICEMFKQLRYFDLVINDDETFQSHCYRLRDELLFPAPPKDSGEESKEEHVWWDLEGARHPPLPTTPRVDEVDDNLNPIWQKKLDKNITMQFDALMAWARNKDKTDMIKPDTLVRVNKFGCKQLVNLFGDNGPLVIPVTNQPKKIAGGSWLEGRVVKCIRPPLPDPENVTVRGVGERVREIRKEARERWLQQQPRDPKGPKWPKPEEVLEAIGLFVRVWSKGLLVHATGSECPREMKRYSEGDTTSKSSAGWTITKVNGRTVKSQKDLVDAILEGTVVETRTTKSGATYYSRSEFSGTDEEWKALTLSDTRTRDEAVVTFERFPMWGDGFLGEDSPQGPSMGSLGRYVVRYDADNREETVDAEFVEPFPWTRLTVQRVARLKIGEGKAENQIHALAFARGEVIQAIDMNQYATSEQAQKIPFLLNDFFATPDLETVRMGESQRWDHHILIPPYRIVGFPEWCYTRNLSMVGDLMGAAEWCFVTITQRVLSWPLRIRTHYGHPDFFDGYWARNRGGTSKASPLVNTNEDIFAGYEMLGRGEQGSYVEYLEVHKGRETSFPNATVFEAKLAQGAAQQIRSFDVYRLNRKLNIFQRFSLFFASISFYVSNLIMAISINYYILSIVLFALSGITYHHLGLLDAVIAVPWLIQIGYMLAMPMIIELVIQKGFWRGVLEFIVTLPIAVIFFVFQMRTKTFYFLRGLLVGSGGYAATGRGFGLQRQSMKQMYKAYSESHFIEGMLITICLLIYAIFGSDPVVPYLARTFTIIIIAISWLWAPIIFNPMPSTQELQQDLSSMMDWISTKNIAEDRNRKPLEKLIEDLKGVHLARRLTLLKSLFTDLQSFVRQDHRRDADGGHDSARSYLSDSDVEGDMTGRSSFSDSSSVSSLALSSDGDFDKNARGLMELMKRDLDNWRLQLYLKGKKDPACFSWKCRGNPLVYDREKRACEIYIEFFMDNAQDWKDVLQSNGQVASEPLKSFILGTVLGRSVMEADIPKWGWLEVKEANPLLILECKDYEVMRKALSARDKYLQDHHGLLCIPAEHFTAASPEIKLQMLPFDEWSRYRLPTFQNMAQLVQQYWLTDDGKNTDDESWACWWLRNVLFQNWESEDKFFPGLIDRIGNCVQKTYLQAEFYFPWVLISLAFFSAESVWYLILIVILVALFQGVNKMTKDRHEYAQLMKALTLITVPFAIMYFENSLMTIKELFWSLVLFYVVINIALRAGLGLQNFITVNQKLGLSGSYRATQDKKNVDTQGGIFGAITNRKAEMDQENTQETRLAQLFIARASIPSWMRTFRSIIPFTIMVLLALGNFVAVILSTWLMAMMYNGSVAEAWRKAYIRSSAAPPPASGGGGGGAAVPAKAALGGSGVTMAQQRGEPSMADSALFASLRPQKVSKTSRRRRTDPDRGHVQGSSRLAGLDAAVAAT